MKCLYLHPIVVRRARLLLLKYFFNLFRVIVVKRNKSVFRRVYETPIQKCSIIIVSTGVFLTLWFA